MQISWQHVKREERKRRRRRRAKAINAPEFTSQQSTVNSLTRRSLKAGNASLRKPHKRKTKAKAKWIEFVAMHREVARQREGKREREWNDGKLLTHTPTHTHTQVTGVVCIVAALYLTCTCHCTALVIQVFCAMCMYVYVSVSVCVCRTCWGQPQASWAAPYVQECVTVCVCVWMPANYVQAESRAKLPASLKCNCCNVMHCNNQIEAALYSPSPLFHYTPLSRSLHVWRLVSVTVPASV